MNVRFLFVNLKLNTTDLHTVEFSVQAPTHVLEPSADNICNCDSATHAHSRQTTRSSLKQKQMRLLSLGCACILTIF